MTFSYRDDIHSHFQSSSFYYDRAFRRVHLLPVVPDRHSLVGVVLV